MAGGAKSHRRLGSSRIVKKTTHVRSTDAKLHPEARGLRRAVTRTLGIEAQVKEQESAEKRVQALLTGVSRETIDLVRHSALDDDFVMHDIELPPMPTDAEKFGQEHEWVDEDMPVSGDFLDALKDISESRGMDRWKGRWYKQTRRWRLRRQQEEAAWGPMIEPLADRYLRCQYSRPNGATAAQPPSGDGWSDSNIPGIGAVSDANEDSGVPLLTAAFASRLAAAARLATTATPDAANLSTAVTSSATTFAAPTTTAPMTVAVPCLPAKPLR
ncbi:uncharacterized protein PHACADRAFT_33586 [Phanerochaete carnosa HHB-10118-sp]|uniref:Uncharacterized protein n=1 Tax=Phanerochaete carnosa (strain HHB-10118-sp) TaxID=650164 RepID=K5UI43_PHACS|nr:uncharacterized protein PHACADRAFT_33586 [Phanerochaete carnosa HHB-10118-sp]EKM49191.1 hypothetical protein PHACADRAFT_33586 [Phanerochaete carnosa HHB-10118-sp]